MTSRRAAWLLVAALAVGGCTSTGQGRPAETAPAVTGPTTPSRPSTQPDRTSPTPTPAPSPTPDPGLAARAILTDVDTAARETPDGLRAAATAALDADLVGLVHDQWAARVHEELPGWPVHVGEASLALDGTVALDVVIAVPPDADSDLVLRWLPSAPALGDAVEHLSVTVDGVPTEPDVDAEGARMRVPVPVDRDVLVRVEATYRVPARELVADDGSPAGYGLLARTDEAVMLGHWLPLVALATDDGPMLARGDVGAFPPGVFSVVVQHEGTLVSGGEERDCPEPTPDCTWLQGVGLRDLAVVLLDRATTARATAPSGVTADVHVPDGTDPELATDAVADEAARALELLADDLGPLPWPTLDVVAAPIAPGAIGMEFPGMVWVDPGAWPGPGPDLGSYVLAHEVGHQWFHALVGNGSLSAPVVDESLAQYLSVLAFDGLFGDGQGAALADRSLGGRHEDAVAAGVPDEAPAQPLGAFSSGRAYGAAVYGRGGQAWVEAEQAVGRAAVVEALRVLVARFGLRQVDEGVVLDIVREIAPAAADPLADGWGLTSGR